MTNITTNIREYKAHTCAFREQVEVLNFRQHRRLEE
jgi:hypothetical protein